MHKGLQPVPACALLAMALQLDRHIPAHPIGSSWCVSPSPHVPERTFQPSALKLPFHCLGFPPLCRRNVVWEEIPDRQFQPGGEQTITASWDQEGFEAAPAATSRRVQGRLGCRAWLQTATYCCHLATAALWPALLWQCFEGMVTACALAAGLQQQLLLPLRAPLLVSRCADTEPSGAPSSQAPQSPNPASSGPATTVD